MGVKSEARTAARRLRASVDLSSISEAIVGHLAAWEGLAGEPVMLLYAPLSDEVDVTALAGATAVLPRLGEDGRITLHPFDARRERHSLGFEQPVGDAPVVAPEEVDVALVPGVAFDEAGTRLGRGGGHYDRLLASLRPDAVRVGVTPEINTRQPLPAEPHDVAMTHLATEAGVRPVGGLRGMADELVAEAEAWIRADPDPATRSELRAIVDSGDRRELEERMGSPLRFGTAGIRGEMGAGPARINRAVVIRTTAGVAEHLRMGGRTGSLVVLGFDGRRRSRDFAEDAAGVLAAADIDVRFFAETTPTPLVAFACRDLGATAGVVITASHNPPSDNGYKVYDANGAQIVPPVDSEISAAIDRMPGAIEIPRVGGALDGADSRVTPLVGVEERYMDAVFEFRGRDPVGPTPHIAYTALHGVGGASCLALLEAGGHASVSVVPEQHDPDGEFPTVEFPNPEEPGALDLVEALGDREGVDVVLANDPDADRLAVSIPTGAGWRRLTGNEIGVLLGDFVLRRVGGDGGLVVNSVVSSPMLRSIAAAHGARFEQTLTGFKWIANAGLDLEREGLRFLFGYEEALGYTIGPVVRDKDGMSAALWFADLVAAEAEHGRTILDRLDDLWDEHGLWMSAQHSVRLEGSDGEIELAKVMGRLRTSPPASVAGRAVTDLVDFAQGAPDRPRWLPAANLVVLELEGGSRVLARPSGTEPKLKFYADVRGSGEPDEVRREAVVLARGLAETAGL